MVRAVLSGFIIRGQFWPSGIVIACICVCVCVLLVCANSELVCAITHHPFKLGPLNLDLVMNPLRF